MSKLYKEVIIVINGIVGDAVMNEEDYDTSFKDLGVDSLDMFNILLELEEKYEIDFPEEDVEKLNTVNLIVAFINENKNRHL
jgi:acyl carrier protein